jgi:hypothetical protein
MVVIFTAIIMAHHYRTSMNKSAQDELP